MPPAPKRSSQRRRTNSPAADAVHMDGGRVVAPELGLKDPHPLVVDLYEALKVSGQSQYYEPSDWARARIMCELLSRQLKAGRVSSTMYATLQNDLAALLTCEGDRRRLRMEIERHEEQSTEDDLRVSLMQSYRSA